MKATIVNTVDNTTKVVELPEAVNDLSGLKHFLNVSEGQFFEGTTHTDLTSNSQALPQLPEEKKERGYVFFVSPVQNKFKNGAYSRKECYAFIKDNNLGEAVKSEFGRNFTQVSTDALNNFIMIHAEGTAPANTTHEAEHTVPVEAASVSTEGITTEKELWIALVKTLSSTDTEEVKTLISALEEGINNVFPNPYSAQDIANMR